MAALNIKNEEVVRKVGELAELEGESMTTNEPLLFVGDDVTHTDIRSALV